MYTHIGSTSINFVLFRTFQLQARPIEEKKKKTKFCLLYGCEEENLDPNCQAFILPP